MTAALEALVGTWRGEGGGDYPTIAAFTYTEEIVIGAVPGKPRFSYVSRTRGADGEPLHSESGFLRLGPDDRVELVLAHGFGAVEVAEGEMSNGRLELLSTAFARTSTAKVIEATSRSYRLDGDTLTYDIAMAAVGQPLTHHLKAELHRIAQ